MSKGNSPQYAWRRGRDAEHYVLRQLVQSGWQVIARNWRGGGGELDLVVLRDAQLNFVEVKARNEGTMSFGDRVPIQKQERLIGAAETFLIDCPVPFDEMFFTVALVDVSKKPWTVELLEDAFSRA